jgi:hypothetical protein
MNNNLIGHISEDLLFSITDVKHHYIESENPEHHWHLVKTQDENILDLGCGFHMIEPGWETTPEYFINRGAKKIIGVDPSSGDILKFKSLYPEQDFYCDAIDSVQKLDDYINNNNITSLKMDIEGYEVKFIESLNSYTSLKYVAIETHSKKILNDMIKKLISLNFNIDTVCTFYPRVYNICNLIYASRK